MKKFFLVAVFMLVTACYTTTIQSGSILIGTGLPAPAADTCQAHQYAYLIDQDASVLERILLLGKLRIIRPNQVVTMEFRPERINFKVDAEGQIRSIFCS